MCSFKNIKYLKEYLKKYDKDDVNNNYFLYIDNIELLKDYLKENDVNKLLIEDCNILFFIKDLDLIKYLIENTNVNINHKNYFELIFLNYLDIIENKEIIEYLIINTDIDVEYYLKTATDYYNKKKYDFIENLYKSKQLEKELLNITSNKIENKKKVSKI